MSPRFLALAFTAIMFVGALPPGASATHIDPLTPDVPVLPKARPSQDCIPTGIQPEVLARVNALLAGDAAWWRDEADVPGLCLSGGQSPEFRDLIVQLDAQLELLRRTSREIQRQVDGRLEATLPESSYPNDLVEPRTILLNDVFDGRRIGGFGEWEIVTDRGEPEVWHPVATQTLNGTRHTYRFGSNSGYELGAHQFLVSPEIDLTALKGNKTAVQDLVAARDRARAQAFFLCNQAVPQVAPGALLRVCGDGRRLVPNRDPTGNDGPWVQTPTLDIIVRTYEMAFDDTIASLPVMQHGAHLDLTYRMNMDPNWDGVRMWVYSGTRQPDRSILFPEGFGRAALGQSCVQDSALVAQSTNNAVNGTKRDADGSDAASAEFTCVRTLEGGVVIRELRGMARTRAFSDAGVADRVNDTAFTGDVPDFITTRLNLTRFMDERIWILFEVRTRTNERGGDPFTDTGRYGRFQDYGFELSRVAVEGDAYHRNVRLKDVAATYSPIVRGNEFGDDPRTVRTTTPPGNEAIVAWLHNAGDYRENTTLHVQVSSSPRQSVPQYSLAGQVLLNVSLEPDEVKTIRIPWSAALSLGPDATLQEGHLYKVDARLDVYERNNTIVGDQVAALPGEFPPALDPNATRVRPANAAETVPGAGTLRMEQLVRSATLRNLTPMRADAGAGVPLQFCVSVQGRVCEEERIAGPKGEPRQVLLGVRNDGNAVQNATATLIVRLDGVDKPEIVSGSPLVTIPDLMPGESRPVTWTVVPTEPGIYEMAVALQRGDAAKTPEPLVERRMFVQRSTGLLCVDTLEVRECGAAFTGSLARPLLEESITAAAFAADGTLYVATDLREADESETGDGRHYGKLAAQDPATREWRIVANLSATRLNQTLEGPPEAGHAWGDIRALVPAPDGAVYLAGDNLTALRWNASGLARVAVLDGNHSNFTAGVWHDGTAVFVGTNGTLFHLNGTNLTRVLVKNASAAGGSVVYNGTFRAIVAADNGYAYAMGDRGVLLAHNPTEAIDKGWNEARIGTRPVAWATHNATLRAAAMHADRLFVVGDGTMLVNASGSASQLQTVHQPAALGNVSNKPAPFRAPDDPRPINDYRHVFSAHTGGLHVLDYEGRLFVCDDCPARLAPWRTVELALPPVVGQGPTHPARVTHPLTTPGRTVLLGEAGLVADLDERGLYEVHQGWTTTPALQPRDGGVLQTLRDTNTEVTTNPQALMITPAAQTRALADGARSFRVLLNHSVRNATPPAALPEIRLVYLDVPALVVSATGNTGTPVCPARTSADVDTTTVCHHPRVRQTVVSFERATRLAGWETIDTGPLPAQPLPAQPPSAEAAPDTQSLAFFGLELYAPLGVRWAIDDVVLQACPQSNCAAEAWKDVLYWRGPNRTHHVLGDVYTVDIGNEAENTITPLPSLDQIIRGAEDAAAGVSPATEKPVRDTAETANNPPGTGTKPLRPDSTIRSQIHRSREWEEWHTPFDIDLVSAWHATTQYADRPVFAANNEMYLAPIHSGGSAPRLYSDWDTRLVSPVIDLRDGYDPRVSFRHSYAFRLSVLSNNVVQMGDGGVVEIQYLREGAECGANARETDTCGWSRWYPVRPDGGYPTAASAGITSPIDAKSTQEGGRILPGRAFWGRAPLAVPDETGEIGSTKLTDTYAKVNVTLAGVTCKPSQVFSDGVNKGEPLLTQDCVPLPTLTGRKIRVGFHLLTVSGLRRDLSPDGVNDEPYMNESTRARGSPSASFPGEGWYITDFKVLGARQLGIDLVAENMSLRVGYDVGAIGIGPGTTVPVNVTVRNAGAFDALGYTGRLEIHRVLDRALRTTQLVDTLSLPQQPVLEVGKAANHTLSWSVPAAERAEYVFTFTATPIGIDEDEDPLDNIARIGSIAKPILASTVRRFNVEFAVSPENATSDITRYIPVFLNNTGNVPLTDFTVERRIRVLGRQIDGDATTCAQWRVFAQEGRLSAIVDCRVWTTDRAAPPGARTPLTSLASSVSPTTDLFWKAPERANFLVSVAATTGTLQSATDRRVSAFATYLFDDVESGPRGESDRGNWVNDTGWAVRQPGFRSPDSYTFGEPLLGRYPADANDSLVSPTVDLGNARTARVAFYHKYNFEEGFDGGVLEASADGGRTWSTLDPTRNDPTSAGYNRSIPIQPGSPLHPSGDPTASPFYAFTSDSAKLPTSVDGWTLSQVDLTKFDRITERSVPYEEYTSREIQSYGNGSAKDLRHGNNTYYAPNWCPGAEDEWRCWEVQNLTEGTRRSPTGGIIWWSGSPSLRDDGVAPLQNHVINISVPLTEIQLDQTVVAEWWEYSSRYAAVPGYVERGSGNTAFPKGFYSAYTFQPSGPHPDTYRINLGRPEIVETQGKWYKLRSDLTDMVKKARLNGDVELSVMFAYSPVKAHSNCIFEIGPGTYRFRVDANECAGGDVQNADNSSQRTTTNGSAAKRTDYGGAFGTWYASDPGFAISDFSIAAIRIVRGQPFGAPLVLAKQDELWNAQGRSDRVGVFECGIGVDYPHDVTDSGSALWPNGVEWRTTRGQVSCLDNNTAWVGRAPLFPTTQGRNWAVVTELPGVDAAWAVVDVRDERGRTKLPTSRLGVPDVPKAWWTGETPYSAQENELGRCDLNAMRNRVPCPEPNSESRLVTPAFDLNRVAGETARLSFQHRYAFYSRSIAGSSTVLASGGAVEIQEYDAQLGTWSEWKQLYTFRPGDGYNTFTGNVSRGVDGVYRFDPPFDNLVDSQGRSFQWIYGGTQQTWDEEQYDISAYLGKRVRFGFHVAFSGEFLTLQGSVRLTNPDGLSPGTDLAGWWVKDVAVVGDVIVGEPVQLRWRAATDGNVQDGVWQVDDVGVFGSRYRRNVGLFVNESLDVYGGYNDTVVKIPVTIRNLGDSVRRGLAVEVINVEGQQNVDLNFTAPGAPATSWPVVDGRTLFRIEGFTLGPGQTATTEIHVRTPKILPARDGTDLLLILKEFSASEPLDPYVNIVDNEVQGLLTRVVDFSLQAEPFAIPGAVVVKTLTPKVGDPIEAEFTFLNPKFGPALLNLSCSAKSVTEWEDVVHPSSGAHVDTPITSGVYPCELVSGTASLTVPAGGETRVVYRVTPTHAGYLRIHVNGTIVGSSPIPLDEQIAGVPVGVPSVVYEMPFEHGRQFAENFTVTGGTAGWEYLRGNERPGALFLGVAENDTRANADYNVACTPICRVVTKPIDLHNFSAEAPAFLSFWHQDRFARWDGAQVKARVLRNELRPNSNSEGVWSPPCILRPTTEYEGRIRHIPAGTEGTPPDPGDPNNLYAQSPQQYFESEFSPKDFFVSPEGIWEDTWDLATFDLSQVCRVQRVIGTSYSAETLNLTGATVRFEFELYTGPPSNRLGRGQGHGWLIDDIRVSPHVIEVKPKAEQRATLLDDTTKAFHVVVTNRGASPDIVDVLYDAGNSSAPTGSIHVPTEPVVIQPGETKPIRVDVKLPRDPSLLPAEFKARIVARSVFDRNAGGAATLSLNFAPRPWPELAISVEKPRGVVQEGTDAFIPITVENTGLVGSVASRVRVVDRWGEGNVVEHDLPIAEVPSYVESPEDALRVLEFRWRPERGSVGPHTLTFVVDPDALGEEYSRANNERTIVVEVSDLLIPDLHVANLGALALRNAVGGVVTPGLDADVARYEITAGELVSFDLKVANTGRAGATNVDVRAFIGPLSLPPKTIPYIAPGSEVVVTFNWLAQKGEHEIEFVVRSEVVEISSANNRYPGRGVTLLTVKGYEIEVDAPALLDLLEPGTEARVPFRITNAGNAGEDLVLRAIAPAGMSVQLPREGFFLRAGETYEASARLVLAAEAVAGEQFITIEAIARENPMKVARGSAAVRVNASFGGSVAGGLAIGAPPTFSIPVELVNEGNSLEPWSVLVRLPAGWSAIEPLPAKVVVPAHSRTTLDIPVQVPIGTPPGERAMAVRATLPNGETREGIVKASVLPLRAAGVVVQEAPPAPERGSLVVPIRVENKGNVQQPFSLVLLDAPKGIDLRVEPASFDLPPGGEAVAALIVKPNASIEAGTYTVTGYTLFAGVTPQTDEGRANVQTLRVPVTRQDLSLAPLEYSPRAGLDAGDRVTVKATVSNRGSAELARIPVHLYVDDVFIEEAIVERIAAGARVDVTFNWTALPGSHTLTAVVDPYSDTVDADRADNGVSALVAVGSDVPAGGVAAGRADTPAPGLALLLAAGLAAALLATRGNGSRRQRR